MQSNRVATLLFLFPFATTAGLEATFHEHPEADNDIAHNIALYGAENKAHGIATTEAEVTQSKQLEMKLGFNRKKSVSQEAQHKKKDKKESYGVSAMNRTGFFLVHEMNCKDIKRANAHLIKV